MPCLQVHVEMGAYFLVNHALNFDCSFVIAFSLFFIKVDRKLVKQTVMTSVYGVTFVGAREQIKKRLKERGVIADDNELYICSCYAAKVRSNPFLSFFFPLVECFRFS